MNQKDKDKLLNYIRWRSFRPEGWTHECMDSRNLRTFIRDEM